MFLIDNKVYFCARTGKLYNFADEIILGENVKECLNLLLENQGKLVTKEDILNRVWHSKGIVVSDNAVRQTMHILRKSLMQFSPERQIITTVPRYGYMISHALLVSDDDDYLFKNIKAPSSLSNKFIMRFKIFLKNLWPGYKGVVFGLMAAMLTLYIHTLIFDNQQSLTAESSVNNDISENNRPADLHPETDADNNTESDNVIPASFNKDG